MQVILIGVILGWATGLNKSADVVGAVSSFFVYLGFDAMACVAGEAINAERNLLLSIMITLAIVTTLYVAAAAAAAAAAAVVVAAAAAAALAAAAADYHSFFINQRFGREEVVEVGVVVIKANEVNGVAPTLLLAPTPLLRASFSVPPSHPYWALSKKAHPPSASATGSTIPSAELSDGSHSTMCDHMISWETRGA